VEVNQAVELAHTSTLVTCSNTAHVIPAGLLLFNDNQALQWLFGSNSTHVLSGHTALAGSIWLVSSNSHYLDSLAFLAAFWSAFSCFSSSLASSMNNGKMS